MLQRRNVEIYLKGGYSYNTYPGDSLQSLLNIIILIEAVIVIQSELVEARSAEISMMQIWSLVCKILT